MFRLPSLDLIKISSIIALTASMIIGSIALRGVMAQRETATASLQDLQVFELATAAATAITKERWPLEQALSLELENSSDVRRRLAAVRTATDRAIEALRQSFVVEPGDQSVNFNFVTMLLRDERRAADALLDLPLEKRQISMQLRVARGMSAISEAFTPIVDRSAQGVIEADESLTGQVNVARLLGALYESATRLPSEVMPALKRSEIIPPEAVSTSLRVQQRILALWDVGVSQLEFGVDSSELRQALGEIRSVYFGQGFPFLTRAIEVYSRKPMDTFEHGVRISSVYGPTTLPILRMRDLYLDAMMRQARAVQITTLHQMQLVIALTAVILVMTATAAWVLYRQMLRPLFNLRDRILALCERRPFAGRTYDGSVAAVRSLYDALETLAARDRERMMLERERAELSAKLRTLSETDELTGLPNRRGFFARLDDFGAEARDYVAVLGDIDHFKAVNDTYGHGVGDEVLAAFSARLKAHVGADIVAARYGGEEFAIMVRSEGVEPVLAFAEALRAEVEAMVVETAAGPIRVTASFGLAHEAGPVASWQSLLSLADKALYDAKFAGRNRVRVTNATIAALDPRPRRGLDEVEPSGKPREAARA